MGEFFNPAVDALSVEELKSLLDDTLWGTRRGLTANSDTRAEVTDLVTQLEALNPTPSPNESIEKLDGEWMLVYTSNSELLPLLALGKLPLLEIGNISQIIDGKAGTVENKVEISVPFSKTSIESKASFDVRSPKLLEITFTDGKISTPELMSDFELPSSVDIAGQIIDLSLVKSALQPIDGPLRSAISQAAVFISGQPDLTFATPDTKPTWLLNTYLDEDLRIARGDGGSLFIMKKKPMLELPENIEAADNAIVDAPVNGEATKEEVMVAEVPVVQPEEEEEPAAIDAKDEDTSVEQTPVDDEE